MVLLQYIARLLAFKHCVFVHLRTYFACIMTLCLYPMPGHRWQTVTSPTAVLCMSAFIEEPMLTIILDITIVSGNWMVLYQFFLALTSFLPLPPPPPQISLSLSSFFQAISFGSVNFVVVACIELACSCCMHVACNLVSAW